MACDEKIIIILVMTVTPVHHTTTSHHITAQQFYYRVSYYSFIFAYFIPGSVNKIAIIFHDSEFDHTIFFIYTSMNLCDRESTTQRPICLAFIRCIYAFSNLSSAFFLSYDRTTFLVSSSMNFLIYQNAKFVFLYLKFIFNIHITGQHWLKASNPANDVFEGIIAITTITIIISSTQCIIFLRYLNVACVTFQTCPVLLYCDLCPIVVL